MEDLRKLQYKPKLSIAEINDFILKHPNWAATIIRNALDMEMYMDFCLSCQNFNKCYEKLGAVKIESRLGCICNEFMNQEHSEVNRQYLKAYFKQVILLLNL
jgi:hypothetical protein